MTRRMWILGGVVAILTVALGWLLAAMLTRVLQTGDAPRSAEERPAQTEPAETPPVPRIKATLLFGAEDGRGLIPVEQEVPLAEGTVAQARALVEAQLAATAPAPLVSTIPQGTTLRALFITDRNEAFVDLDPTIRDQHPGGSMNELFTVFTIVNVLTLNLRDVQSVQLLIDGREVDTLAGHVDLRRPLRKNESLITP